MQRLEETMRQDSSPVPRKIHYPVTGWLYKSIIGSASPLSGIQVVKEFYIILFVRCAICELGSTAFKLPMTILFTYLINSD